MRLTIAMCAVACLFALAEADSIAGPGRDIPLRKPAIGVMKWMADRSGTTWGMSGMEIIRVNSSVENATPIMRSFALDARTVEILSRVQDPPLKARDVRVVSYGGRKFIAVRGYMLIEVTAKDAQAAHSTKSALAREWAASVRRVLPQVAPQAGGTGH